jgi:hypothetical protein
VAKFLAGPPSNGASPVNTAKSMKAAEFETEQRYFISRRRLINRAVLGWGVVYGFALAARRAPSPGGEHGRALADQRADAAAPADERAASSAPAAASVGPGLAFDRHGRADRMGDPGSCPTRSNEPSGSGSERGQVANRRFRKA